MSTVSRPTPCRPTTLSFVHAAIRLSVQLGRRRNSIPAASAATLASPASVSSSQTTTRAPRSRSALRSGLIGPASTTRGRDSVAIGAVSFPSRTPALLPGDEDQAGGVEREGRAVEPAVELHVAPALRPQHRRELVGGVEPDLALADQLRGAFLRFRDRTLAPPPPRAPAARRGIERVLDAKRPAVHALTLLGRQRAHQLVTVPGAEHEPARGVEDPRAGLERRDPDDPLDVARRVRRRLERLRDLGPGLAEEPLALEHGGHCSGDREGGLLRGWPEPGATRLRAAYRFSFHRGP